MIVMENIEINGVPFVRTTSNSGRYVVRDGVSYEEAYDPAELGRTYTETNIPIDDETEAEEIVEILTGGAT